MMTVKVTFENNDSIVTGINGTRESVSEYYKIGRVFNLGCEDDLMTKVKKLEFLED